MTGEGLRRFGQAVREGDMRGAAILASRGLLVIRTDRMLVLVSPRLPSPAQSPIGSHVPGLTVRMAGTGDLAQIIRHFPHNAGRYADRMQRGDECLLVQNGSAVIGMTWLGFDKQMPRELGCAIHLPEASCWEYDTFVLAEHRKLGAFGFLMKWIFTSLPARGIRHVYAAVRHLNKASRVAHGRIGYTTAGVIDRFQLPGLTLWRMTDGAGSVAWSRGGDGGPTLRPGPSHGQAPSGERNS